MTLSDKTLALLRCPASMLPLRVATNEEAEAAFGDDTTVNGALICEDGSRLYPIRDGLPVLLESESKAT
ncbi:MAG: Trm112 family protein [Verrucomicrobiales bacterium]|nr:Trm112 family protein [Verrucomicrobiales bacterium]